MFLTMVSRAVAKGWRKKALAVVAVALGTSLAVAILSLSLDIGDKVNRELKSYGANILVTPPSAALTLGATAFDPLADQSYLPEDELPKLKMIFWRNNIMGFAPYLKARGEVPGQGEITAVGTWFEKTLVIPTGEEVTTGVSALKSWWQVEGAWPSDSVDGGLTLVGQKAAQRLSLKPGDSIRLAFPSEGSHDHTLKVSGVVSAGGETDDQVFVPLSWLQEMTGLKGKVSLVEVSALTMPKNELARKVEEVGIDALSRKEFETWYCSPYVDSVSYQIEEAMPGARARPIRQIAESEGIILGKIQMLMALLAAAALAGSALGVSSLMGASVLERAKEVGLLKALGAYSSSVAWLFLAEAMIIGAVGGFVGWAGGVGLAKYMALSIFGSGLEVKLLTIPAAFGISIGVALLGSLSAVRAVARLEPARILVGGNQ